MQFLFQIKFPSVLQIFFKFELKRVNGHEITSFYRIIIYLKHPVSERYCFPELRLKKLPVIIFCKVKWFENFQFGQFGIINVPYFV